MSKEVVERIRARVARCRWLANMVNDELTTRALQEMAAEGEADILRLEAELSGK